MTLEWFDASDAEKLGQSLAQFFINRIPLPAKAGKNKARAKQLETVDKMYFQIEQFKLNNKLNIYTRRKID